LCYDSVRYRRKRAYFARKYECRNSCLTSDINSSAKSLKYLLTKSITPQVPVAKKPGPFWLIGGIVMSIFVEYDEHNFEVTNLARHDRLTDRERKKIASEVSWCSPFSGEASTRGRSVAHSKRYAGKTGKPLNGRLLYQKPLHPFPCAGGSSVRLVRQARPTQAIAADSRDPLASRGSATASKSAVKKRTVRFFTTSRYLAEITAVTHRASALA